MNTNFTDVLNGTSDGTKDFSINALTCAGTATFNGAVNLGNATTDDLTFTGSVASSIPVKTADTYDLGTAALPFRKIYLGDNANSVAIGADASASADWTFTLPPASGTVGYGLQAASSGAHIYVPMQTSTNTVSDTSYTVTDTDGYRNIIVVPTSTDRVVTLPTAADNTGRRIKIMNSGGANTVIVKGEAAGETVAGISGTTGFYLIDDGHFIEVECNGSVWLCVSYYTDRDWTSYTPTAGFTAGFTATGFKMKRGTSGIYQVHLDITGTPTGATYFDFNMPDGNIDTTKILSTDLYEVQLGHGSITDATGGVVYPARVAYNSTSLVRLFCINASSTYASSNFATASVPITFASGDDIDVKFEIPVANFAYTVPAGL